MDTHVIVRAMLTAKDLLSPAGGALETATERCVSAAGLYETTYRAMLGKWPEIDTLLAMGLGAWLRTDGSAVVPA